MDFQSEGMPRRMSEQSRIAVFVDMAARSRVDLTAEHTAAHGGDGFLLCVQHGLVNMLHFIRRASEYDGTRHIRAVAVHARTEIHRQERIFGQRHIAGNAVRISALFPRDGDGLERHPVRTVSAAEVFQLGGDLRFGHAGTDKSQDVLERAVGNPLRAADAVEFIIRLDAARRPADVIAEQQLAAGQQPAQPFSRPLRSVLLPPPQALLR